MGRKGVITGNLEKTEFLSLLTFDKESLKKIISTELRNIRNYRSAVKDRNKFVFFYYLLNMIKINMDFLEKILVDDSLTEEKVSLLREDEKRYILKKPFLLKVFKQIPVETLKKIREISDKAIEKGEEND